MLPFELLRGCREEVEALSMGSRPSTIPFLVVVG
jgi:hypothetical protein